MAEFLADVSLFPLVLTLGSFQIGVWCQRKTKSALCNPLLIGTLITIAVLLLTGFDLQVYQAGNAGISWLLTPATVCLAVPLYEQLKALKKNLGAILTGVAAGTAASMGFIAALCVLFRLDTVLTISLLPKSVTTAIGVALTESAEGIPALTSAAIIITGILGNLLLQAPAHYKPHRPGRWLRHRLPCDRHLPGKRARSSCRRRQQPEPGRGRYSHRRCVPSGDRIGIKTSLPICCFCKSANFFDTAM